MCWGTMEGRGEGKGGNPAVLTSLCEVDRNIAGNIDSITLYAYANINTMVDAVFDDVVASAGNRGGAVRPYGAHGPGISDMSEEGIGGAGRPADSRNDLK